MARPRKVTLAATREVTLSPCGRPNEGGTLSWDGRPHFRGVTLPYGARKLHATAASGRPHLSGAVFFGGQSPPVPWRRGEKTKNRAATGQSDRG
jgi:hypothetical protein